MPQIGRWLRTSLLLASAGLMLVACGPSGDQEAETTAATIRHTVATLEKNPKWPKDKCLCVGLFRGEAVEDFPADLLKSEFSRHAWVRNWSECSQLYGKKKGLAQCKAGMSDYICSTAERKDLPAGTTRVLCHVNGKNELLFDEYDVTRQEDGLQVKAVNVKALYKTYEPDL